MVGKVQPGIHAFEKGMWVRLPRLGLAGVLVTPLTTMHYAMGLLFTLKGFAAAILGGLNNPFGAVIGGVTLGLLEALAIAFVSSGYKDVIAMSILIVIMILLPNGMLGRRTRRGG